MFILTKVNKLNDIRVNFFHILLLSSLENINHSDENVYEI